MTFESRVMWGCFQDRNTQELQMLDLLLQGKIQAHLP